MNRASKVGAVLALALLGCEGGNDQQVRTDSVGPDGGTLDVAGGIRVVIPSGSLPPGTQLRALVANRPPALPPPGFVITGPVLEIIPHGTAFASPITISIPASNRAGIVETLANDQDRSWEPVSGVVRSGAALVFSVEHVSYFAEVARAAEAGTSDGSIADSRTPSDVGAVGNGDSGDASSDARATPCGHIAPVTAPVFDLIGAVGQPYSSGVGYPEAIAADGSKVIGYDRESSTPTDALFGWTKSTGYTLLSGPGGRLGDPSPPLVNCDGSIIVALGRVQVDAALPGLQERVRLSPQGAVVLQTSPGSLASPRAISADGSVIVGENQGSSGSVPVRWLSDGSVSPLGGGLTSGYATAISADGKFIAGTRGAQTAYRYSEASGVETITQAQGSVVYMSADGQTVFGQDGSGKAFLWTSTSGIGHPCGAVSCTPSAISGDGKVLIGDANGDAGSYPFVWDSSHGLRRLSDVLVTAGVNFGKWVSFRVTVMTPDKRVLAGSVTDAQSNQSAFRLVLPDHTFD